MIRLWPGKLHVADGGEGAAASGKESSAVRASIPIIGGNAGVADGRGLAVPITCPKLGTFRTGFLVRKLRYFADKSAPVTESNDFGQGSEGQLSMPGQSWLEMAWADVVSREGFTQ
jgi:hypothetical protein